MIAEAGHYDCETADAVHNLVDDDLDDDFKETREREPQIQLRAFEHEH